MLSKRNSDEPTRSAGTVDEESETASVSVEL